MGDRLLKKKKQEEKTRDGKKKKQKLRRRSERKKNCFLLRLRTRRAARFVFSLLRSANAASHRQRTTAEGASVNAARLSLAAWRRPGTVCSNSRLPQTESPNHFLKAIPLPFSVGTSDSFTELNGLVRLTVRPSDPRSGFIKWENCR